MIETILLSTTRLSTFSGGRNLTAATAFFFERSGGLFLVTSRHVLFDAPSGHAPDSVQFAVHLNADDLTQVALISLPLYEAGVATWTQAQDSGGDIDVAALEIPRTALPPQALFHAFGTDDLDLSSERVEAGTQVLLVGFPLGFYDTTHYLPVVRQAVVASAFGIRFQQRGLFLTDARMHRGSSGAPVVTRHGKLLGVHSARFEMKDADAATDDSLGLNCAWYADILMTLTAARR